MAEFASHWPDPLAWGIATVLEHHPYLDDKQVSAERDENLTTQVVLSATWLALETTISRQCLVSAQVWHEGSKKQTRDFTATVLHSLEAARAHPVVRTEPNAGPNLTSRDQAGVYFGTGTVLVVFHRTT